MFWHDQWWNLKNFIFQIDDKDTLTMKTSNMKLMDMVSTFNNKCKEKDVGEWIICHQAKYKQNYRCLETKYHRCIRKNLDKDMYFLSNRTVGRLNFHNSAVWSLFPLPPFFEKGE